MYFNLNRRVYLASLALPRKHRRTQDGGLAEGLQFSDSPDRDIWLRRIVHIKCVSFAAREHAKFVIVQTPSNWVDRSSSSGRT